MYLGVKGENKRGNEMQTGALIPSHQFSRSRCYRSYRDRHFDFSLFFLSFLDRVFRLSLTFLELPIFLFSSFYFFLVPLLFSPPLVLWVLNFLPVKLMFFFVTFVKVGQFEKIVDDLFVLCRKFPSSKNKRKKEKKKLKEGAQKWFCRRMEKLDSNKSWLYPMAFCMFHLSVLWSLFDWLYSFSSLIYLIERLQMTPSRMAKSWKVKKNKGIVAA